MSAIQIYIHLIHVYWIYNTCVCWIGPSMFMQVRNCINKATKLYFYYSVFHLHFLLGLDPNTESRVPKNSIKWSHISFVGKCYVFPSLMEHNTRKFFGGKKLALWLTYNLALCNSALWIRCSYTASFYWAIDIALCLTCLPTYTAKHLFPFLFQFYFRKSTQIQSL